MLLLLLMMMMMMMMKVTFVMLLLLCVTVCLIINITCLVVNTIPWTDKCTQHLNVTRLGGPITCMLQ